MAGTKPKSGTKPKPGTASKSDAKPKSDAKQKPGTKQHPAPAEQAWHDPYGHGNSVAAWTAVSVVMFGSLLMCIAVAVGWDLLWLFIVGAVIALLGPVVGKVLGAMGYGSESRSVR